MESRHRIAIFRHVKSGLLLNLIPGGSYQMGSNFGEKYRETSSQGDNQAQC